MARDPRILARTNVTELLNTANLVRRTKLRQSAVRAGSARLPRSKYGTKALLGHIFTQRVADCAVTFYRALSQPLKKHL